jgi:two-component system invasion response regulator UvrY
LALRFNDSFQAEISVAICDDHPFFREGLKATIAASPDIRVAAEAEGGVELVDLLRERSVDVVILDWTLPGRDGLEVLKDLRCWGIAAPVLMLSAHHEDHYALRALRAGAQGYLTKGANAEALFEALRTIAAGRRYITSGLAEQLADEIIHPTTRPRHHELSDREYQVLIEFAAGKGIKEISDELNLSPSTVGTYRARVLTKLNLANNAELIRYAVENGLVE